MTNPWTAWVRLLDRRETGEILALLRIGAGLAVFINVFSAMQSGVLDAAWVDDAFGGYRDLGRGGGWLLDVLGGANPTVIWSVATATVIASLCMVVGLGGRVMPLIAAQGILALSMTNGHARGSYDALHSNILWLLFLSQATATWSLDSRIRTGSWSSNRLVPSWPRQLMSFQLVALYFFTALHKVSADWLPGGGFGAVYYVLQMPGWHRIDMTWTAWVFPLTQGATVASWLFELTSPVLLIAAYLRLTIKKGGRLRRWLQRFDVRWLYMVVGIGMHLTILITMEVGPFSLAMLAIYPSLFTPAEFKGVVQRFRNASRLTTSPPGEPSSDGGVDAGPGGSDAGTELVMSSPEASNSSPNEASGS